MPGIDDPLDAVKQQYPELYTPASVLMDVGSEIHPFAGMVNAVRNFFSKKEAEARIKALLQAIEWYVRENERRIEDLSGSINSPDFIETLLVAVDKTLHTANLEKIRRFAKILGHRLVFSDNADSYEDAATYIRTLSELGDSDIEVLSIIHAFQAKLLSEEESHRKTDKGRLFWGIMTGVRGEIAERGISFDEFYSRCSKLNGYGLVHRVGSGASFWSDSRDDLPYQIEGGAHYITRSGKELIDILGNNPELIMMADKHRQRTLADIERLKAGLIDRFPQPYR